MKLRFLSLGTTSLALGLLVAACGGNDATSSNGQTSDGGLLGDDAGNGAESDGSIGSGNDASLGGSNDAGGGGATQDGATTMGDDAATGGGTTSVPLRGTHTTGNNLMVNGVARTYDLSLPNTCDASTKVPVIILFHADDGRGSDIYNGFPLEEAAAVEGKDAIYVYPNGQDDNDNGSAWNIYDDPGAYPYSKPTGGSSGNQDVDFFDAMVANFTSTACADTSHVFITGFSNGGYMSEQLARWRASVVKGAAPQSGGSPSGVSPSDYPTDGCPGRTGAVPVLIIHGQSDNVVDPCLANQDVSYWEIANSCTDSAQDCTNSTAECGGNLANPPASPTTAFTPSPCVSTSGCKTGEPVIFCSIPGMGHDIWSSAPTTIWDFFAGLAGI